MSDQADYYGGLSPAEQARLAHELENNPLLMFILQQMDEAAVETWRRSTSPTQREEQWHLCVAILMVRKQITSKVENLKLAQQRTQRARQPTV